MVDVPMQSSSGQAAFPWHAPSAQPRHASRPVPLRKDACAERRPRSARQIEAIWEETARVQQLLFLHCLRKAGAAPAEFQLSLFPEQDDAEQYRDLIETLVRLLVDSTTLGGALKARTIAQSFLMNHESIREGLLGEKTQSFVPAPLRNFLLYSASSFFARSKNRRAIEAKLAASGLEDVSAVVEKTERELMDIFSDTAQVSEMKGLLRAAGLELGSWTPRAATARR